ncbi:MAG: bifunctional helix-turn-helix transcriptional regulator/GNAT family N-acetyltransferase [Alistipes sp.]|nr:bifunctional helix-turn-helix transcriptional regulator/GNAT family N-acetyltransferase [Alistipes sp.]
MDFFERTGIVAVGSRLRMLTDRITDDASRIYGLYGVELRPKWFPVFRVLQHGRTASVTAIAREIGHSHPSVSTILREMTAAGLVERSDDPDDRRRRAVRLTDKALAMSDRLDRQCADVAEAVGEVSREAAADLWLALAEWERALDAKSLFERVEEVRRRRSRVRIVPFEPCYGAAFRSLNEEWITSHWQLEQADIDVLDNPQESIVDRGGEIFVALLDERPVGVVALCRMDDPRYDFELAKLAVSPSARGAGVGMRLCRALIDRARESGGRRIFLESNTRLHAAISLYRRLGFRELADPHPSYVRGDIQMELNLI